MGGVLWIVCGGRGERGGVLTRRALGRSSEARFSPRNPVAFDRCLWRRSHRALLIFVVRR